MGIISKNDLEVNFLDRVKNLDQLALCARRGFHVRCPHLKYAEKWMKASSLWRCSMEKMQRAVDLGMECKELELDEGTNGSTLSGCQEKIRALGLSQDEIARRIGSTQQTVSLFMRSGDSLSSTIDNYYDKLNLSQALTFGGEV